LVQFSSGQIPGQFFANWLPNLKLRHFEPVELLLTQLATLPIVRLAMKPSRCIYHSALFVAIFAAGGAFALAQPPAAAVVANQWQPQQAVVLLRNGSVLSGLVMRSGDYYEVQFDDGELRIRVDEVAFVGPTLEACYEHRRQGLEFQKVGDHLALAEWCLRHDLIGLAGRELRDAMACDPTHPKIGLLERRLRLALEAPATNADPAEPTDLQVARPEDLDRMIRSMPTGTVETFTNVIQPLLINQCSTSNCHGPTSESPLKLLRVAAGKTQSRRATQRNLHAVLNSINHDDPDSSLLLTMPTRPHGSSAAAVFTSRQAFQYRQLVDWVYAVTNRKKASAAPVAANVTTPGWPDEVETTDTPASSLTLQPPSGKSVRGKAAKLDRNVLPTAAELRAEQGLAAQAAEAEFGDAADAEQAEFRGDTDPEIRRRYRPGERPSRSSPQRGAPPDDAEPADPFDPDEFNQQFGGG
jgi:hypothetical protein